MDQQDITTMLQAAATALNRGDAAGALGLIRPLAEAQANAPQLWMARAEIERQIGDMAAFEASVDHLIGIEPMAVRAYGWKGDCRLAAADPRAAASWYREGVARAATMPSVPPGLAPDVERQREALRTLEQGFADELAAGLSAANVDVSTVSDRFSEAIDILNGQATVQLQQPGLFYFPGLPQRAFYEREEFDWVRSVEAAADAVAAELTAALAEGGGDFTPYLTSDADRPYRDHHGMTGNADWSSITLTDAGQMIAAMQSRFPQTCAMLNALPLCRIGKRAPAPMFSLLKAGARIPPHHGAINTRLICHLPLVVPGNGALRVGNHVREWERGRLLIFDDSIEHEAWNDADSDRIVLIFDVWRPELTAVERDAVAKLFGVIDGV
jgi:hypothetical protein